MIGKQWPYVWPHGGPRTHQASRVRRGDSVEPVSSDAQVKTLYLELLD
jgi:hypothetical protein